MWSFKWMLLCILLDLPKCVTCLDPPKVVSLTVSQNDKLHVEITPPDKNDAITHYEGDMRIKYLNKPIGELQTIASPGGTAGLESFVIDGKYFLAAANYRTAGYNLQIDSIIYQILEFRFNVVHEE